MARGMIRKRERIWYIVYPFEGRKKWERVGPKRREAEKLLASRLEEIRLGKLKELKKIRFNEFVDIWMCDFVAVRTKESTRRSYRSIIDTHLMPRFENMELGRMTARGIQSFVSSLARREAVSTKTISNILAVLKQMLGHAVRWGYLHHNPADQVDKPRVVRREMYCLTPDEVQAFLAHVNPKYYALFLAAVMTGLRRGELLGLTWGDINWEREVIHVTRSLYMGKLIQPKTERSMRVVAMPERVAHELKKLRLKRPGSEKELIFRTDSGRPIEPDNLVKRQFLPALKRAGLKKIRFHDLRHTHASLLIAQGESVKYIQDQLGHASVQTTLDRYGHLFPEDRKRAAIRLERTLFGHENA